MITHNATATEGKASALMTLSMRFELSWSEATRAALAWMEDHSSSGWNDLRHVIRANDVVYVNRRLVPAPLSAESELVALHHQMVAPGGLDIRDRRFRLRVYRQCFVGQAAVQWLMQTQNLTREEAVWVGQRLMRRGTIRHVVDEQDFADEYFFYNIAPVE
ncbi:MAG: hypothetical protein AAFY57_11685 [Cyanobacteria bacterium J06642_2]